MELERVHVYRFFDFILLSSSIPFPWFTVVVWHAFSLSMFVGFEACQDTTGIHGLHQITDEDSSTFKRWMKSESGSLQDCKWRSVDSIWITLRSLGRDPSGQTNDLPWATWQDLWDPKSKPVNQGLRWIAFQDLLFFISSILLFLCFSFSDLRFCISISGFWINSRSIFQVTFRIHF